MEIISETFNVHSNELNPPTDIELISINNDNKITFKYKINNKMHYTNYLLHKNFQKYIFFEIINKSLLWIISFNSCHINNLHIINFRIFVNNDIIDVYKNISLGFNFLILELFFKLPDYNKPDLTNKSIIPYNNILNSKKTSIIKKCSKLNIKLYKYQINSLLKMYEIENNTINTVEYSYNINYNDVDYIIDPISNTIINNKLYFNVKTKGGILSDEMGLGKTITCIALISLDNTFNMSYLKQSSILPISKFNSKATLILCPSHLSKQWANEINRCNPDLTVINILTKNDFNKYIFYNFINSDIIITTYQFLMNFKYYPSLYYNYYKRNINRELSFNDFDRESLLEFNGYVTPTNFNFKERNKSIDKFIHNIIQYLTYDQIKNLDLPLFEFFNFKRLIVDEGHEIFGELLGNLSLNKYMSQWISNIDSNYYWYISGTPFSNLKSVKNCAKFINLTLDITDRNIVIDYGNTFNNLNNFSMDFMNKEYIWNNILKKVCIRHTKKDIVEEVNILGYEEEIIWVNFTDIEKKLYESKKNKVNKQHLQQLCCHLLVVESTRKIFGSNTEVDLLVMQDKLIEYHKKNFETYTNKLDKLDSTKPEYFLLKKNYENQINESKYMITILEKIKSPDNIESENCSICIDTISNPILTNCGHLFCYDCLKQCLQVKNICPICKNNLNGTELLVVNYNNKITNSLIEKYGSKLGKLIDIINKLLLDDKSRIIIFSQWDDMLSLVGKVLEENNINNSFVKGNVWTRNSAINKFKNNDNKIIMLSLKNAASGTNLTEATHIIFIEPINAQKEEIETIEKQSIARACRIGQKQKVKIIRILVKDTIEEEIYNQFYL